MVGRFASIARPALVALAAAGAAAATAPGGVVGPFDSGRGVEPALPWHVIGFPFQTKPFTRFEVVEVDAQRVLRVEADGSYGILLYPLAGGDGAFHLSWRWRVDRPNEGADLRQRSGDDVAAQVCVGFDLPLDPVPFIDRQLLRIARLASKDRVPAAAVCYVWDPHLPTGTTLDSAFTRRIRLIVLGGSGTAPATWQTESRDVAADFLRLFGDEAHEVPPIIGVAVAADADNTHAHTLAYVADLTLRP
jgi:hypothetical protein